MALLSSNYYTNPEGSVGNLSSLWSPTTTTQTTAAAPTTSTSINPLTGQPYNWTSGSNYGSLDQHLYGYNYTEPYNEYANYGDMGYTPNTTWVPGALEQIANRATIGSAGDASSWAGLFEDDIYKMLADQYGNKGYTFGQEEDGRMWRKSVYDQDGNVVWSGDPYYHEPNNPWTQAILPLTAFALGAPALGELAGIAIPSGTPTLGSLLGGTTAAAEGSGAWLGEGVASGVPAWDAAAGITAAEAGGAAAAGGLADVFPAAAQTTAPATSVQGALNELVGQSMLPSAATMSPEIATSLGELTGQSLVSGAAAVPGWEAASPILNAAPTIGGSLPTTATTPPTVPNPSPTVPSGVQNLLQNTAIKTLMGQLLGGSNSVLSNLAGMYSAYQNQGDLSDLENMFTGMYGQDSPYAQALRQQLDRRDAAAGRRSQYGPREVELQAKLADQTSRNAMAISNLRMAAGGQRNALLNNAMQGLGSVFGGNSNIISSLSSLFNGTNWNEMTPEDVQNWQTILDNNPDLYSIPELDIPIPEIDFGG